MGDSQSAEWFQEAHGCALGGIQDVEETSVYEEDVQNRCYELLNV